MCEPSSLGVRIATDNFSDFGCVLLVINLSLFAAFSSGTLLVVPFNALGVPVSGVLKNGREAVHAE